MKSIKFILLAFSLVVFVASLTSCGNKGKAKTEVSKQGKEYTSAYICPMHCKDSGSDKAGKCPACKMDYKLNKDHKSSGHDGHDHGDHDHSGHDHSGHDHDSHEGHNH